MMRKTIVRTMSISTVKGYVLELVDGIPKTTELEPVTVCGEVTEKEGLKALKEEYGNKAITVSEISVERNAYEISVKKFLEHATKIEK